MLYRDTDGRIKQKGISKDIDDFDYEKYEDNFFDDNWRDRADYEYEKMMDRRAEEKCER